MNNKNETPPVFEYEFTVLLTGIGENAELAWLDAVMRFTKDPSILKPDLNNAEGFWNK